MRLVQLFHSGCIALYKSFKKTNIKQEKEENKAPESEIEQLERKGPREHSLDRMKLMAALIFALLNEFSESYFPNNNVLIALSFCAKIFK